MSYDGGGWSESDEPVGQLNNATTMMSILGLALLAAFSRGLIAADGSGLPSAESSSANATTKYSPMPAVSQSSIPTFHSCTLKRFEEANLDIRHDSRDNFWRSQRKRRIELPLKGVRSVLMSLCTRTLPVHMQCTSANKEKI